MARKSKLQQKSRFRLGIVLCLILIITPVVVFAIPDTDNDGLLDAFEIMVGTQVDLEDSDGDGFSDAIEVAQGYDPLNPEPVKLDKALIEKDSDNDGLTDFLEANIKTDYMNPDSDGDGYKDGDEIMNGYSPLDARPIWRGKRIAVDTESQRISYFVGPHHINSFAVSTGLFGMDTPKGEFTVMKKMLNHLYRGEGYNYPNTKWNLLFKYGKYGNYYVHGAYWHNNFGNRMSHGCVNVSYADMEPLYNWADVGTRVVVR